MRIKPVSVVLVALLFSVGVLGGCGEERQQRIAENKSNRAWNKAYTDCEVEASKVACGVSESCVDRAFKSCMERKGYGR